MQLSELKLAAAVRPCLERLEERRLLNGALDVWVNDTWSLMTDTGAPGLSSGDIVRNIGPGDRAPLVTRTFGVDAFNTISAAMNAVATGGTVHVLAGSYRENVSISKSLTLEGQHPSNTHIRPAQTSAESMVLVQAPNVTIRQISLRGDGTTNGGSEGAPTVGLDVNGGSVAIFRATITGNDIGVRVRNSGNITQMSENFVNNNAMVALEVQSTAGTISAVFNNNLSGGADAITNASLTTVDASGNWYGVTSQAAVAALSTVSNVDFTPWLNVGTDTSATAGFQGDFTDVNVGAQGQQVGAVGRIQEGINRASGGAGSDVFVHQGTHVESDISVNKAVVIDGVGATADQTVAPAVADGHLTTPGVVFNPASHNAFIVRSSNVTIRDLTIDGDAGVGGAGARNFFGGVVYDFNLGGFNNVLVDSLTVKNLWGVGIYLDGGIANESTGHAVTANTVTNIAGSAAPTGVLLIQASGTVSNNTISDVETGIGTNYIDGGAFAPNLIIRGNDLSDVSGGISASGLDGGSFIGGPTAGDENVIDLVPGPGLNDIGIVLQFAAGPVTVQSNQITATGRDSGIWLYHLSSANAPLITGNTITTTSSSSTDPGDGTGIFATDDGDFFGDPGGGTTFANVSGNTISGFVRGVDLYRNDSAGFTVQLTINNNNTINNGTTGIRAFDADGTAGANGVAIITGNAASIHGNAVGIDVNGGTATISGNHIYDNSIGVRVQDSGTSSLDNNNFDGGANPDNSVDLELTNSPGAVSVGSTTPNSFAGDTFFIDNLSTQNVNAANNTFDETNNFRIEDKMHHRVDTDLPVGNGLVTWVANNIYVTDPAGVGTTDSSIQRGVDAANTSNTVNVESGTYDQVTDVNKGVTVLGIGTPTITRTTGSSQSLMTVSADNVTIQNFDFDVARPFANAGIAALNPATFDNLLIHDNNFDISGTGGSFPNPFLATSSVAIALLGNGTPFESVTITSNVINFSAGPTLFARGIWLREIRATIGGATPADGNSIIASTQDVLMQFASGGTSTIQNNTMTGAGVDITEPNSGSPVMITDNDFLPASPLFPQSVLVKNADSSPVTVSNNTFTGHTVGVLSAGSTGTVVSDNDFTPAVGASSFSHVRVDTRVPTGGPQPAPFLPNSITITGNDFNEATVAGGIGVELLNGNPAASVPDFGTVTVGGAGALANMFQNGLSSFIRLDQGATPPYAPVTKDLDGTQNLYEVSGGTKLPSAMTLAERFELEDKLVHKVDVASLGFVTVVPGRVFVTTNSFEAPATIAASVQRGIDAASATDTVHVADGTYSENVLIDKALTLTGQSQSGTIIRAAAGSVTGPATGGSSPAPNNSVIRTAADDITIEFITVDGDGPDAGPTNARNGIITDFNVDPTPQTNLVIHHVTVKNIFLRGIQMSSGISGTQYGTFNVHDNTVDNVQGGDEAIAIFNFGDQGIFDTNTVTNSTDGIVANWSIGTQFLNNIVTNSGGGVHTDNMGGFGGDSVADTITGNQVSNGTAGAIGIFVFAPYLPVTVAGNTVTNVETGMGAFGSGASGATVTFSGNTITGGTTGLHISTSLFSFGSADVLAVITSNDISNASGAGILVEDDDGAGGATATANINSNNTSIHDNFVGIDVDGGTATISNNDIHDNTTGIRVRNGGNATITSNTFNGNGIGLVAEGGSATITDTQEIDGVGIGNGGLVTLSAGGNVVLITTSLTITGTGQLDIRDNAAIINYTGASPIASIFARLQSGYASGAWTGPGIMSTDAANEPNDRTGVGYAEATDLFGSFPATFEGQSIDSTSILLKYALYGDTDLNGNVNLNDFNRLAANFGSSPRRWSQGDFTFDQLVNLDDFNRLAANFGLVLARGAGGSASVTESSDAGNLPSIEALNRPGQTTTRSAGAATSASTATPTSSRALLPWSEQRLDRDVQLDDVSKVQDSEFGESLIGSGKLAVE